MRFHSSYKGMEEGAHVSTFLFMKSREKIGLGHQYIIRISAFKVRLEKIWNKKWLFEEALSHEISQILLISS